MSEVLRIRGMPDDTTCEVHAWPVEDFRTKLIPLMRERHGKGGVNACSGCISRAREHVRPRG